MQGKAVKYSVPPRVPAMVSRHMHISSEFEDSSVPRTISSSPAIPAQRLSVIAVIVIMTTSLLVLLLLIIAVSGQEQLCTPSINASGATGCGVGQYCYKSIGQCFTRNFGTCKAMPKVCTMDYTPVCGCDRKTYSNACAAGSAGMIVHYTGKCKTGEASVHDDMTAVE
jgi:hypothetical protein